MDNPNQEISGFTGIELHEAYWWVTHRALLHRVVVVALVVICLALWGLTLWGLVRYWLIDWAPYQQQQQELATPLINYGYFRQKHAPRAVEISGVQVLPLGNNRYDFAAEMSNPNTEWAISSLRYVFTFSGQAERQVKETFVLPGQHKYLIDLGVESLSRVGDVRLVIEDLTWRRVAADFAAYQASALDFAISDVKFVSAGELKSQNLPVSKTRFTVKNNSPYNYWEGGFYILLYRGPGLVGINYLVQQYLDSGAAVNMDVSWYQHVSTPDRVEVVPDINLFNPGIFRPIEAGSGELK
ncbi:hypothetical protein HY933_04010 [Candidatus Falkowbacteria bacterium]|nr:hypothetical protein [Candidatus Falkowbacteria bacterium]